MDAQTPKAPDVTTDEIIQFLLDYLKANTATVQSQPFFDTLHQIALQGMGVGLGDSTETSGERAAMAHLAGALARRYPNQTLTIFDAGANIGQFVSLCRSVFGVGPRRYFCFEPSAATFATLTRNTQAWPDVRRFQVALGDRPSDQTLFTDTPESGLASLYKRRLDHFGIDMAPSETVRVVTLDQVAADLGIERIHYLKLDVEGYEFQCLQGAERLLAERRIDFIQFEFGGTNIDSRTYFQDFWYLLKDYAFSRILRDGLLPIETYSEREEMFQTQNYLVGLKGVD
jgi:FkbM family methyltransferase